MTPSDFSTGVPNLAHRSHKWLKHLASESAEVVQVAGMGAYGRKAWIARHLGGLGTLGAEAAGLLVK